MVENSEVQSNNYS